MNVIVFGATGMVGGGVLRECLEDPRVESILAVARRSGRGRFMWARVRGATERQLLEMPFPAYVLRPGYIQPLKGVRSGTKARDINALATAISKGASE